MELHSNIVRNTGTKLNPNVGRLQTQPTEANSSGSNKVENWRYLTTERQ